MTKPTEPKATLISPLHARTSDDAGQTSIAIIGIFLVTMLVAVTLLAITSVNLQARKLLATADSVVIATAQEHSYLALGPRGIASSNPTQAQLRRQVTEQLNIQAGPGSATQFENLRVESVAYTDNGRVISLRLSATARPPIVSILLPDGVTVYAESSARTRLDQ